MNSLIRLLFLVLAISHSAHSAVIYYSNQNIPIGTTFAGTYVDVESGANSSSTIAGWDINLFFGGVGEFNQSNFQPVRAGTDPFSAMQNLAIGDAVSGASTFASGIGGSGDLGSEHLGTGPGQFLAGQDGFIGFQLDSVGGPLFGWMRVRLTNNDPGAYILDWAYEDSGASILTGFTGTMMIPEPSRALLLLLGLSGISLRRRRLR